jgi:hypothetical protein
MNVKVLFIPGDARTRMARRIDAIADNELSSMPFVFVMICFHEVRIMTAFDDHQSLESCCGMIRSRNEEFPSYWPRVAPGRHTLRKGIKPARVFSMASVLTWFVLIAFAESPSTRVGEILYRQGILPSAKPLLGKRQAGGSAEGTTAACINRHRRSGMGGTEGEIQVPPVTAKYLCNLRSRMARESDSLKAASTTPQHTPYTDVTLARAIREGIGSDGRTLNYLMPRYALGDDSMASLIAYLKDLSKLPSRVMASHGRTSTDPAAAPSLRKLRLDCPPTCDLCFPSLIESFLLS